MFEPKILTKVNLPSVVETNLAELEGVIAEKEAFANSLVVTDNRDDVVAADRDAADLKKMQERIKRFRIDLVGWWKDPITKFEDTCKSYEKRLGAAYDTLRERTAEVKERWAQERKDELVALFRDRLSDQFAEDEEITSSPWWKTWLAERTDPKAKGSWLNKTTRQSTIDAEIEAEFSRVRSGMTAMNAAVGHEPLEVRTVAWNAWRVAFSIEDAMNAVAAYKAQQEAIAEARAATGAPEPPPPPKPEPRRVPATEPIDLLTFRLAVTGSRDALVKLRNYGESIGITFTNLDRVGREG